MTHTIIGCHHFTGFHYHIHTIITIVLRHAIIITLFLLPLVVLLILILSHCQY
jgi:hypothetical protein